MWASLTGTGCVQMALPDLKDVLKRQTIFYEFDIRKCGLDGDGQVRLLVVVKSVVKRLCSKRNYLLLV
jgi:hypothetical protein